MSIYRKILPAVLGAAIIICSALGFGLTAYSEEGANNEINLTVGENIVSNYSIDIAYYRALGADTLQYTYNANDEKAVISKTKTVDISENESRYAFSVYQAPAQLAEPVNVTLLDGENTVESFSFSAYEYCTNCIEMTDEELGAIGSDSRLKDECRAIIAYAKACQEYFPSYMANEGTVAINDTYSELFIENSISYTPESNPVKSSSEDIKFSNVSFICDSMSKLRIYLRVPAGFSEAPEATVPEDAQILTHYNGANSYIDILNIKPKKYGEKITLEYSDGASISLSVLDYAYLISGNQSETVRNFAKTLINYCEKSKVLFHYNAHFLDAVAAAEPTCTQPGNTAYYRCVDCGKLFSDSEGKTEITPENTVVSALGHDLGEWSITTQAVAPTCTQQGSTAVETRSCSRCDYSETRGGEAVEALGHDYQAVVTAPTCTEGGYTTYTCSRCNDSYTDDATAALGHSWGEWAVTTAPTYT
ncbi:MAG: hypothetical protein IKS12_02950, partial [Eubacterium sp.]|nr:hypothetical protein [Eubacterium sp.]